MRLHRALGLLLVTGGIGLLLVGWTPDIDGSVLRIAALAFGGLTVAVGLALFARVRRAPGEHWMPDGVEEGLVVPRPGDDLRDAGEPAIRERFRQHVAEALLTAGYSREDAEAAIAEGTWTDNELAAGYLAARSPDKLPDESVLDSHRAAVLEELATLRDQHE